MNSDPKSKEAGSLAAVFFWTLALTSALLLALALALSVRLWQLPKTELDGIIGLVKATLFTYGLGLGLFGSGWALTAPVSQRRFGTATTVHGSGFLAFALTVRPMLEQQAMGYSVSLVPLTLPLVLWMFSLVLFCQAAILRRQALSQAERGCEAADNTPTAEPPQPLSPL